jgi:carbamoyltransferase
MLILGISAYYHDSAAVLIEDGKVVTAIEEERFARIKHYNSFPYEAIKHCLKSRSLKPEDVDYVAYYEKPLLKFERILETFLDTYPYLLKTFLRGIPEWFDHKIKVGATIRKLGFKNKVFFIPHHYSHAAASYLASPFKNSAILTVDGVGEWQTTGMWHGQGNKITPLKKMDFPDSLGLFYSTFTAYLGFRVNEDEYKVMGLAAYGKPVYYDKIRSFIDIKDDGSFRLDPRYFGLREGIFDLYNRRFGKLLGRPRYPQEKILKRHADLAASVQKVTEEIYFKMLNYLHSLTHSDNLCLSGGVALNALANGKIYDKTPFRKVYIFGAAGDSGAAFGASLYVNNTILGNKRVKIDNLYFGSRYDNDKIEEALKKHRLKYKKYSSEKELINKAASLIAKGKIIGWFQSRCEYGPRALGNRSILCKPNPRSMKAKMNIIKRREQFRPFAGSILQSEVHKYFEVPEKNYWSPFMTFCFKVKKEKSEALSSIVHEDGTCRIQTIDEVNGRYFALIKQFYRLTGIACIMNTSFNVMGEPIVETPEQAIEDYLKTKMDSLFIGDYQVLK